MTTTEANPANGCPKCGGALWDNRATKKNPKAPDYKCKDKACDGCIWPPKPGTASAATKPAQVKQGFEYERIPAIDGPYTETGAAPNGMERITGLDKLFTVYGTCFDHAFSLAHAKMGNDCTHEGIAAQAATLFIAAQNAGLTR